MHRFKNILFHTDGGPGSARALARAIALTRANRGRLTVVGVVAELPREMSRLLAGLHPADLQDMAMQESRERLERLVRPFRTKGEPPEISVLCGTPFLEIIRAVLRSHHDLVIMCADGSGRLKGMLFGSTNLHLLRKCPCPVWVIRPARCVRLGRIPAAIDPDSADAVRSGVDVKIMELAISLTRSEGAELHVIHVWDVCEIALLRRWQVSGRHTQMDSLVRQVQEEHRREVELLLGRCNLGNVSLRVHITQGDVGRAIPRLARRLGIDLIVMGTIGRTGVAGFFVGNTAETVQRPGELLGPHRETRRICHASALGGRARRDGAAPDCADRSPRTRELARWPAAARRPRRINRWRAVSRAGIRPNFQNSK
ncbi:MAG: hypothetical protein FJ399_15145 [Verrucomicrobia bacterium]|nr:hypothetical protein [Verrucomicrobiota bacterium]